MKFQFFLPPYLFNFYPLQSVFQFSLTHNNVSSMNLRTPFPKFTVNPETTTLCFWVRENGSQVNNQCIFDPTHLKTF